MHHNQTLALILDNMLLILDLTMLGFAVRKLRKASDRTAWNYIRVVLWSTLSILSVVNIYMDAIGK